MSTKAQAAIENVTVYPTLDRILIERTQMADMTASGLYIPEAAQQKAQDAKVIAVDPGKILDDGTLRPTSVQPGDRVLLGKYSGTDVEVGGKTLTIIRDEEILAIVRS